MKNSTNIVLGLQSENTLKAGGYGASEADAADLGYIKGGVSIEHSETPHEVKVDQALGAVDRVPTDESMKIKVTLAEATLSNLALAFGYGSDAVSGGTFRFGSKTGLSPRTLYINVRGAGGGTRKYTFWKCMPTGKTTQAYKRDGETVADMEFEVLADTTKSAGQRFGRVDDLPESKPEPEKNCGNCAHNTKYPNPNCEGTGCKNTGYSLWQHKPAEAKAEGWEQRFDKQYEGCDLNDLEGDIKDFIRAEIERVREEEKQKLLDFLAHKRKFSKIIEASCRQIEQNKHRSEK